MQNYSQFNFNLVDSDELMNYLVVKHHGFTACMLDLILGHSLNLANDGISQALEIYEVVNKLNNFALKHFYDEEEILFPYAKKILEWQQEGNSSAMPVINIMGNPICRFIKDHEVMTSFMEEIRDITGNYAAMDAKKNKLMLLHHELWELDNDIKKQIFIEDHILFNKLLSLQKDMIISKFIKS
ncbi:MAG: hemerythrin domain-containing protein [Bacteroidota bacterium]|jgi:regulator of cell morphogenesis and NO signaling